MSNILGIDHPLVAVLDLAAAQATYRSLGFLMKPPGHHPWGTSTALVIFKQQLLELVGIGDETLLDGYAVGGFAFGRHVQRFLDEREGVGLTALFSHDAELDEAAITGRGGECAGTIRFGREVVLTDGSHDRTSTVLKPFPCSDAPRLSIVVCEQQRRDLIEFPEWMDHPNGACGFVSATILAEPGDQGAVRDWLSTIHGDEAVGETEWGFQVQTGKGYWRVVDRANAGALFGAALAGLAVDGKPSVVSLDLEVSHLEQVLPFVQSGQFTHHMVGESLILPEHQRLGGILLTFQEQ